MLDSLLLAASDAMRRNREPPVRVHPHRAAPFQHSPEPGRSGHIDDIQLGPENAREMWVSVANSIFTGDRIAPARSARLPTPARLHGCSLRRAYARLFIPARLRTAAHCGALPHGCPSDPLAPGLSRPPRARRHARARPSVAARGPFRGVRPDSEGRFHPSRTPGELDRAAADFVAPPTHLDHP